MTFLISTVLSCSNFPSFKSPAVLYRLMNGEMPKDFNPKIWWLELGLSDIGRDQCSEEVVVLGILRVVEEIMNAKKDAKIVINSLFPMAELRQRFDPQEKDMGLEESFGEKPQKPKNKGQNKAAGSKGKSRGLSNFEQELPTSADYHDEQRLLSSNDRRFLQEKATTKMNNNKKTQQKYNPVTHKENKLPLWTSIMAINKELAKFSGKHDNVFFFDVTDLFTEPDGKFTILKTKLITETGIPLEAGYDIWEQAVATKARQILSGEE